MRILMLAPQPFFEPRGTPFSVLGRLRALSDLGHEIDLVTYHVGADVSIRRVSILRIPALRFIRQVPIGPSWVKMPLDLLLFARALGLLLRKRYDLIHSHEEASFFGVVLARVFRIRHLYDMHSSLPEQLKNFRRFRSLVPLFQSFERLVINASSAVISICPALAEHVNEINRGVPQVMIENVASNGDPYAVSEERLRTLKMTYTVLEGRTIVLYTGTFEPYQGIDLLLAAGPEVLRRRPDVIFCLVGGKAAQVDDYRGRARQQGLAASFLFTGARPAEEMPAFLRVADVLVSPRTSGTNTPLKVYAYLESGKPIVATALPTHTQVLDSTVACLVDPEPKALAEGILSVVQDPSVSRSLGAEARRLFERCYSFQQYLEKTALAVQMATR
jgi:glycosyltransferase involved in cell wall biosynthesis